MAAFRGLWIVACFLGCGLGWASDVAVPHGYRIYKRFALPREVAGVDGTLQLLVDRSLSRHVLSHYGQYDEDLEAGARRPKNGILRYVTGRGDIVSTLRLDQPVANLEPYSEAKDGKAFFVLTEDWSIGFGSYNGPISNLVVVSDGKISKVTAKMAGKNKSRLISVMRSGKNNWKKVKSTIFPDILEVNCHPDFNSPWKDIKFQVTYSRFHFDGYEWTVREHTVSGFWEDEMRTFPPENLFPKG